MLYHHTAHEAARPSDLKYNNRIRILELFKTGGVYSVAELSKEIGVSRQTVMKAVQFFLEKGIVVSDGKADSTSVGGKRAELFTLSADRYLFLALICTEYLYVSLFNSRGEVLGSATREAAADMGVELAVSEVAALCRTLTAQRGIDWEAVSGICLATPGSVIPGSNILRFSSPFPAWGKNIPIADMLARRLGRDLPIIVENVSIVCGCACLHQDSHTPSYGATIVSAWGGIGACFMVNGRIHIGNDSLVGVIGHMILAPDDDEVCACGSRGCFARQVSPERMRRRAAMLAADYPHSALNRIPNETLTIQDVFSASANGDALARALSGYAAHYFASALRNITLMFNPNWVVFQGSYAHADDHFREVLNEELNTFKYYPEPGRKKAPLRLVMDTRPLQELITIGAYTLLLDKLFSEEAAY